MKNVASGTANFSQQCKGLISDNHLVHSFADLWSLKQQGETTIIIKAKGAHVYDASGKRFLDGIGGLLCVNVGHGREEIIDVIAVQMCQLHCYSIFYNLRHSTATKLAPKNPNHVSFANSGSIANDNAVRILRAFYNRFEKPQKKKVLSRIGAYHWATYPDVAMTTPAYREGWDSEEELVHH